MSSVKPVVPSLSHIYPARQNQNQHKPSASRAPPSLQTNENMSYRRSSGSTQPQNQWTLAPSNPPAPPSSASQFAPSYHAPRPVRNVTEIIPRVYISDLAFVENAALLSSYRITHILSTLTGTVFRPPPAALPMQPVRLHVCVEDLPFAELAAHLPATTAFIRDALASAPDARIVVHCAEGISRSVSVVAAYLMAAYGWAPLEAVHYIKSKRRVANPNFGFVQQLHEYARDSLGRSIPTPTPPSYPPSS